MAQPDALTVNARPSTETLPTGHDRRTTEFRALLADIELRGDAPGLEVAQVAGGLHVREVLECGRAGFDDEDAQTWVGGGEAASNYATGCPAWQVGL